MNRLDDHVANGMSPIEAMHAAFLDEIAGLRPPGEEVPLGPSEGFGDSPVRKEIYQPTGVNERLEIKLNP